MPCTSPLQGFMRYFKDGSRKFQFCPVLHEQFKNGERLDRSFLHSKKGEIFVPFSDYLAVPCGKCISCRISKSREWAVRMVHEASLYSKNCFVTLTFDDDHYPVDGSLDYRLIQLFNKKLRKRYGSGIRFYCVGEYGELNWRAHFHCVYFNHDFDDKFVFKKTNGIPLYVSESLTDLWGNGLCSIGAVTVESAAYCARYVTKKINGVLAPAHYIRNHPVTNEKVFLCPEFSRMSNRSGIGADWLDEYATDVYPDDFVVLNGKKFKTPRYYDRKYELDHPEDFELIRLARVKNASAKIADNTYSRLQVKNKIMRAKARKLVRPLEML